MAARLVPNSFVISLTFLRCYRYEANRPIQGGKETSETADNHPSIYEQNYRVSFQRHYYYYYYLRYQRLIKHHTKICSLKDVIISCLSLFWIMKLLDDWIPFNLLRLVLRRTIYYAEMVLAHFVFISLEFQNNAKPFSGFSPWFCFRYYLVKFNQLHWKSHRHQGKRFRYDLKNTSFIMSTPFFSTIQFPLPNTPNDVR